MYVCVYIYIYIYIYNRYCTTGPSSPPTSTSSRPPRSKELSSISWELIVTPCLHTSSFSVFSFLL